MSDHAAAPSAEIITFPRATPPAPAETETPHQRLRRALASLTEAQAAQRVALARWREAIGDLHASMGKLGQSIDNYQQNLTRISTDLAP